MLNLFPSNLPTIDPNRFWDNYVTRYGDDGEGHTGSVGIPEIVRSEYWKDGIDSAFAIRELQKELTTRNTGTDRSARELKWKLESLPAYLTETELFFGTESADVLRQILKETAGFEFDENFNIRPETIELKTTTGDIGMATAAATKRAKITKRQAPKRKAVAAKKTNGNGAKPEQVKMAVRDVRAIPLGKIFVSTFEPQSRRRKRFDQGETDELAADIKVNGLIQEIMVRPVKSSFEIVVGERRYWAVSKLGWPTIDCTVRELTDQEAFDIQYAENAKRKDIHPVDEAFSYKFLQERFSYDVESIALHVGQTISYVATRLKLLTLDQSVLDAFEKGQILFGHALEIAKYPVEAHKGLLSLAGGGGTANRSVHTLPVFITLINERYLRRLSNAPFPIKSTELRADGLACGNCPDRTGANATLFENGTGRKDSCLKPACWNDKTNTFIQIQRREIALPEFEGGRKISEAEEKKVSAVPLLAGTYMSSRDPHPEKFIQRGDYEELKKPGECDKGKIGVFFNGDRVGQKVYFCIDPSCKKHKGRYSYSGSRSSNKKADSAAALDQKRQRFEELIDISVGNMVRLRVFKAGAEKFAKKFFTKGQCVDFLPQLLAKLWSTSNFGDHSYTKGQVIRELMEQWSEKTAEDSDLIDYVITGGDHVSQEIAKWPEEIQKRILFLFVHGNKGSMYGGRYQSQVAVRELASEYGLDYRLIDAECRLEFAQARKKKHVEAFKIYLDNVRSGKKNAKIPRVHSANYHPKD